MPDFIYTPPQHPLEYLYEDDDLIAINKPAGLLSVMGRLPEHQDSAYLRILQRIPLAKVIHRLDMATSGILLFAKHREVEVMMSKIFQARQVKKYYTAWVEGQLQGQGMVDVPLIADWEHRPRQKVDYDVGKPAQTLYQAERYDEQLDCSRVLLEPITGRSHQLRVHMAHLGHPITGDKLYHPQPNKSPLGRLALHATKLQFLHPTQQVWIEIVSEAPF
ncbi:MAG: pseudouridine synthase [Acinetobacter sp.]|nr:pseudouridine synthase [Acinetobacter sp.]